MEEGYRTFRIDFTSDGVSKLRDVVKDKLKEFMGDYTDDTLVEYVIVLLKNGRSKDEAKSELNVFLGDDNDSFVTWLWDHLGSNGSLYMQPQDCQRDGVPKSKQLTGDVAGKTETHEIEPKAEKVKFNKSHGHHSNPASKGLLGNRDDNEIRLSQKRVDDNEISKNEPYRRVRRTKPSISPLPMIHKKRRRTEEQQPSKRGISRSAVSAPMRLLQFAVRDAIGTSRQSNASESSRKRLRSVVSTATGDLLQEERPPKIPCTFMSVAIKAAAEAVEDVSKTKPVNAAYHQENQCVTEAVGDGNFDVAAENFDTDYHLRNDGSMLREGSPFHENILDSVLGDDGESYEDDEREPDATDVSWLSTSSGRKLIDYSLVYEYASMAEPIEDLGPPRIAKSVGIKTRKAQNEEERDVFEIDNHKRPPVSAVATKPGARLKKNSDLTLASTESEKRNMVQPPPPQRTQAPTGLQNTGPSTDDADSRTIFVSNVHFAATKDNLTQHFNKFGDVLQVIILTDPATGQPKGSAYIVFTRKGAAELALSLDGTSFMSRLLKIARKSFAPPEAASIATWPRVPRPSPFAVPRFSRAPFARGMHSVYRSRVPRSFQWKRGAHSEASANPNSPAPAVRGRLTYVRTVGKASGNSSTT